LFYPRPRLCLMGNIRGLRTRLCPKCKEITPHRTLYAKSESGGRTRWFQLFWACTACSSLNHVSICSYKLESAPSELPSALPRGVVETLRDGPLDFNELIAGLRRRGIPGVRHIFKSDVVMALEYLKRRGVVAEEAGDRTARMSDALRGRVGKSVHLDRCPIEKSRTMTSLYSKRQGTLIPVGALCLSCGYQALEKAVDSRG
jgi:hypothetical protein